ncbi:ATP-binding protein [Sneathiella marina]|uniref:histidine kinase n=1 Tax=Sneathiella marina TaxID=2950108 RepID=A0ABY4W484_9PROT|nr:ATP-binding protein [Sneathiella marina]USG61848.1 ATP-binding protein [Sneathiella marina]
MTTVDKGYHFMMWGVSLIALGTFVDYATEVILALNMSNMQQFSYAVNYRTAMALVFYFPGSVLAAKGLSSWLPAIQSLSKEIDLRQQTERKLIQAKTDAEVANAAKSQFLANMSHELRTPLNAILGFSDILKNESFGAIGSPIYREYSHDIHTSGKHLLDLINDILDVAKIEAGKLRLYEEAFDIKSATEICVNMLSLTAREADVSLTVNIAEDLPYLYADDTRLRQIISNLLSNAIKFTNPGGRVTLSVGLNENAGMYVSVVDTGIGIDDEDIENALSQFGQVDDKYSRNSDGTGLGLSLVQLIISEHGGTFEFSSKLEEGTVAIAHFPAERLRVRPSDIPDRPEYNVLAKRAI